MSTVAVMYHYVRPPEPDWGGIVPLQPDDFERQLDALQAIGDIVPPAALGEPEPGRLRFVLTFDDGTADHFSQVLPRLVRRRLAGLFAVQSGPLLDGRIPNVHLVHALLSARGHERLWTALEQALGSAALGEPEAARRTYPREQSLVRCRVKYALNYALGPDAARRFLVDQFQEALGSEAAFIRRWYLGEEQIRQMRQHGMEFAVHGHHHLPYFAPIEAYEARELAPCAGWLGGVLHEPIQHFVAPFGGKNSLQAELSRSESQLRQAGYRFIHLTEPGVNTCPAVFIKRFNCADLPPLKPWPQEILAQAAA